jgi:phosphate starvation-inducible protein PhoH and related proteins
VVTGDVTQVDLPTATKSGLAEAKSLLAGIDGISFCTLTEVDVVRHPLVQKIIVAYEERDRGRPRSPSAGDTDRPHPRSHGPSES